MTEPNHDDWPDKYSYPRDRLHPDTLRITVESFDDAFKHMLTAVDAVADGDPQPAVVSFATVSELRKILTNRRIELLQTLMDTEGAAERFGALAKALDRDYKPVHDDVTLLANYGIVFIVSDDDRSKRPYLPYERIRLDVELTAGGFGEESVAS
ncbi:hypothetical protein PN416_17335 [Halorubrum ezzemoulense]|jgi:predicted transcriptional regulator|uniref:HVO_A0114 family putative DNA-binding protein n=1 Tax=Halorubrum ezzemoulense TaxID=337243 RepID=UPI00233047C0|nr:hypothetical protein [Halorubrum ezzemoulense]MDB2265604.1 hypothetical protein [Halorubrum ezzemoulense]MDB2269861.1 hypothetical protein [Halorubrum ezzemoulense]MDB9281664.1 hypothetical protein [Halorubrum ezzemoulense]MDB9285146.1 hypothetical protein [Halorubrum ezzemoulense]MDB9302629.1 hypothetical protein [Halorubrum ezzemoulense]